MRDPEYYRFMMSKRVAVKALVDINKALSEDDSCYFWCGYGSSLEPGGYNSAVQSMVIDIKELKAEVAEYRELKKALRPLLGRR